MKRRGTAKRKRKEKEEEQETKEEEEEQQEEKEAKKQDANEDEEKEEKEDKKEEEQGEAAGAEDAADEAVTPGGGSEEETTHSNKKMKVEHAEESANEGEADSSGKIRFGFKPTAARIGKGFSFKKKTAPSSSAASSSKVLQRPVYPQPSSSSSSSFFAGTSLPPLTLPSSSVPTSVRDLWEEWEWDEDEESLEDRPGGWVSSAPQPSSSQLMSAFNAVRLRRWMEEVTSRQELHFIEDLRRRTEQERERIKEQREKDLREREKKEKEEADAAAAAATAAASSASTAATTTAASKKKAAAKTTGKRKGAQAAAATAAATTTSTATPAAAPATGAGKTTKGKTTKAKAAKPPKKPAKAKGKGSSKKDEGLMTADGVKKEDENDEEMLQDIDESYLNLWERLRLARIRSKNEDPSLARYAAYPIDHLLDIKSSLTVNLYPNGFSLGGSNLGEQQSMSYPYDSSTKDFIRTIDSLRLPPDFVELLEEVPCVYYDGCLVVEVRDFRGSSTAGLTGAPVVRRVLLQPDTETIVSDVEQICAEHADWTSDDCLKIEQSIVLATAPPLCLEPDVKVTMAANVLNYNKCKYNLSRTAKKAITLHDPRGEKAAVPKKGGINFALMDFLSKKNYRPGSQSSYDNDSLPISRKPLKDVDKSKKVSIPQLSMAHVRNIKKPPYMPKRAIQFHGRDGRTYCYLELRPTMSLNGYEALISEGVSAETAQENPTPFPVGNMKEAELFFTQIKTLYTREGKICIFDSGLSRGIPTNLVPTPAGPSQPMRPTPQQAAYMSLMRRGAAQGQGGARPQLNPNHPLFQQLASQGANANQFRAAAAAAAAQAAGQQQAAFEGRNFMQMNTPAGYSMASGGAPPGGMPASMPSGMAGQPSGHPSGQMSSLPMSPQSNMPHSGQPVAAMSGPLTPGSSQQSSAPTGQMGPGGPAAMGQVSSAPVPGAMGGMVSGGMSTGQISSTVLYAQPSGMPSGAPGGAGMGMNPMMATYRRASSAAPMRGQSTAMRGRAMPTATGSMPQGQGLVGMTTSGVPSPSTMGPPSSPSPSTPTMGGPMTPNAMPSSQPMGMAPPIGMSQPGNMPMSPMGAPMSPPGMMPNTMPSQNIPMQNHQPMQQAGMPQGMPTMATAARPGQHPLERKFLLENVQQRK